MNNYCTLFDSNYLTRGLAMYKSLVATGEQFTLYIFCFDELTYEILNKLKLDKAVLIKLSDFESEELLSVKADRTKAEYCWTCTPYVIRYSLDNFNIDEVTYVDSDLYFYNKPEILLDEFHESKQSVMITEHRYTPIYDKSETSGIYCVQFMTFKSDDRGLAVLQWWQDRCLEWCYNRAEDGKLGDQKYLDHWTSMFAGVHVLKHLGGGVAPWNIQQYEIKEGPYVNGYSVIFYHFHGLIWYSNNKVELSAYLISKSAKKYIYSIYVNGLIDALNTIKSIDNSFYLGIKQYKLNFNTLYNTFANIVKRNYNVIRLKGWLQK